MEFENHRHECEIKMIYQKWWKKRCPYKGKLSQDIHECDTCIHMVTITFLDDESTIIKEVRR